MEGCNVDLLFTRCYSDEVKDNEMEKSEMCCWRTVRHETPWETYI
jgi:hypothetical protein